MPEIVIELNVAGTLLATGMSLTAVNCDAVPGKTRSSKTPPVAAPVGA